MSHKAQTPEGSDIHVVVLVVSAFHRQHKGGMVLTSSCSCLFPIRLPATQQLYGWEIRKVSLGSWEPCFQVGPMRLIYKSDWLIHWESIPRKVSRDGQERYPSHSKGQNHLPGRIKQSFSKPDQTILYCIVWRTEREGKTGREYAYMKSERK